MSQGSPELYGTTQNVIVLAADSVFLAPETTDQTVDLATTLHVGRVAFNQLIVEAQIQIFGVRAGNGDPEAGYVGVRFQDLNNHDHVTAVDFPYGYSCPFQIVNMAAFVAR